MPKWKSYYLKEPNLSSRIKRKKKKSPAQTVGAKLMVAEGRVKVLVLKMREVLNKNKNAVEMNRILRQRLELYRIGQFCSECELLWYNVKLSACPNCGQTDLEGENVPSPVQ